jgi:hypothetical protein
MESRVKINLIAEDAEEKQEMETARAACPAARACERAAATAQATAG